MGFTEDLHGAHGVYHVVVVIFPIQEEVEAVGDVVVVVLPHKPVGTPPVHVRNTQGQWRSCGRSEVHGSFSAHVVAEWHSVP